MSSTVSAVFHKSSQNSCSFGSTSSVRSLRTISTNTVLLDVAPMSPRRKGQISFDHDRPKRFSHTTVRSVGKNRWDFSYSSEAMSIGVSDLSSGNRRTYGREYRYSRPTSSYIVLEDFSYFTYSCLSPLSPP